MANGRAASSEFSLTSRTIAMDGDSHFPKCFDPYLQFAISTEFKFFRHTEDFKLLLLVELKEANTAAELAADLREAVAPETGEAFVELGPAPAELTYCSLRTEPGA